MHWLTLGWWKYLFTKRSAYYGDVSMLETIICRARSHPHGVVWFNAGGLEPDMHCKVCGDDLDEVEK